MKVTNFQRLSAFLEHIRLLPGQEPEALHLFIIDGPSAVKIARLLVDSKTRPTLRLIASAHYLTHMGNRELPLKRHMTGWYITTLIKGLGRYLKSCTQRRQILPVGEITALSNRECIENYIQDHSAQIQSLTVCNERNPFPARAVAIAKQYGIKTGCIQHGAVVPNYFPVHVHTYFTWSDYYAQLLRRRVPGLNTVSTGRLGYRVPNAPQDTPPRTATPLIVLQPADVSLCRNELLAQFKKIIEVCYRLFNQITLRPHPSDNIMPDITAHIGNRKFTVDSGSLEVALSRHPLTLSLYSTVLYEAPLFGSLPLQYLEQPSDRELMQRCELYADAPETLFNMLQALRDKTYFEACLHNADRYARKRVTSGDTARLFAALQST